MPKADKNVSKLQRLFLTITVMFVCLRCDKLQINNLFIHLYSCKQVDRPQLDMKIRKTK